MTDPRRPAVLHTERLVVRLAGCADAAGSFRPGDRTVLWLERVDTPGTIGNLGVRVEPSEPTAEVDIVLVPEHRGHGYATEALGALVEHLLTVRAFVRVVAFTPAADERSQHLLERVGLRAVAVDGDDLVYVRRAPDPPSGGVPR